MNSESPKKQALDILEQIHRIGFPNSSNIEELSALADSLHKLSHSFLSSDQVAISQIGKTVHKIEHMLDREGDVDEKLYTALNRKMILLKSGLQNHGYL